MPAWFTFVSLAALCLAGFNVLYKEAIATGAIYPTITVIAFIVIAATLLTGGVSGQLKTDDVIHLSPRVFVCGTLAGLLWFGSVAFMAQAFTLNAPISVAVPILSISAILLITLAGWIVWEEPITLRKSAAIALSVVAIWLYNDN